MIFKRISTVLAASLLAGAGVVAVASPASAAITISPGQSWASVLSSAPAGSTVSVQSGNHGTQTLEAKDYKDIKLVGVSRTGVKVTSLYLKNVSNLDVSQMTFVPNAADGGLRVSYASANIDVKSVNITPQVGATGPGIDISRGGTLAPKNIRIEDATYNGANAKGVNARGVRIWAGNVAKSQWPTGITITKSSLSRAAADLVQVGGGKNITISESALFDTQSNTDHNDGVQSYGSDGLTIHNNRFNHSGAYDGPDQAIMVGHAPPGNANLLVTNTTITNNTIVRWNGQGIALAGTTTTNVANNVVNDFGTPGSSFVQGSNGYGYTNTGLTLSNNTFFRVSTAK